MASSDSGGDVTPVNAQSVYSALGLSSEDIEALAQIPENEISVETLPYLIMQLKAKRAEKKASDSPDATAAPDCSDKTEAEPKPADQETETPEIKEKPESPSPPTSSHDTSGQDQEHHGKADSHRKSEREGGRRDSRSRKSSRERQSGDGVTPDENEFDDKPTVFPHICTICKTESNGFKTWHNHIRGSRHTKARRELMLATGPADDSHSSRRGSRSSQPSKRSYSPERSTGDQSSSSERFYHPPKPFTKVVVAKYPMGSMAVSDMLALGKPFGTIVKHLIFPFKGFLEFSTHEEAKEMVTHYKTKRAFIKGQRISLCLSPTVDVIHPPEAYEPASKRSKSSQSMVCFSRLPPGKESEEKVLELAALFGDVRHSRFTEDKALIEMVDWHDADIMVKYYHSNPLRIQDKSIKVTMASRSDLRESSPERSSSKKSDSGKSHSSRQKSESSSSKSASQSCSKDKEKEGEKIEEKEGEKTEEKEEGEKKEGEKTEGEDVEMKEEAMEEESVQVEEEHGLVDKGEAEGISMGTDEVGEKEDVEEEGAEKVDAKEVRQEEEERVQEDKEERKRERASEEDVEEQDDIEDMDFPENMDDFVTLDELEENPAGDSIDSSVAPESKVVIVRPIRNEFKESRKKAMRQALLKMAAPFGEVANFAISYYRREALIELESVEKAHEMVKFYESSKRSKLCGRTVSVTLCLAFNTIEGPSGRTLFISMLPKFKYSDKSLLRLARPFGKITAYCFNRVYGTCYIQMETVEAADRMIKRYLTWPVKFYRTPLKITKCRKGDSLIPWTTAEKFERWYEPKLGRNIDKRRENGQTIKNSSGEDRHSPVSNFEGVCGDPAGEDSEEEEKDQTPLEPYQPDTPVGVSYVVPKSGFFCKLCNVFYTDENKAKSEHCSSLEHYNLLKKKRGEVVEEEEQTDGQTEG